MGGVIVEEEKQLEALGFTINPRGNWSLHAEAVAKEARKRLGAIRRIAQMLDDDFFFCLRISTKWRK